MTAPVYGGAQPWASDSVDKSMALSNATVVPTAWPPVEFTPTIIEGRLPVVGPVEHYKADYTAVTEPEPRVVDSPVLYEP